jgi:hypothetical protein
MNPNMKIIFIAFLLSCSTIAFSQSFRADEVTNMYNKTDLKGLYDQVFAGYSFVRNLGNFGDIYESGNSYNVSYGKFFPNSWLAIVKTGYIQQNARENIDSGSFASLSIIPIHVGGRYYFMKDVFMPYVSFMNGLNVISQSDFKEVNSGVNEDDSNPSKEDATIIRYAFQIGFGFDVKIARNFGVNLNIGYNNSFYQDYDIFDQESSKMMTGFEYGANLSYYF